MTASLPRSEKSGRYLATGASSSTAPLVDEQEYRRRRCEGFGERREVEDRPPRHGDPLGLQHREPALGEVFEGFAALRHLRTDDGARNLGARNRLVDRPVNPRQLAPDRRLHFTPL